MAHATVKHTDAGPVAVITVNPEELEDLKACLNYTLSNYGRSKLTEGLADFLDKINLEPVKIGL